MFVYCQKTRVLTWCIPTNKAKLWKVCLTWSSKLRESLEKKNTLVAHNVCFRMRETGVKYEVVLRFKYYLSEKVPRSQKLTLLQRESFSHNVLCLSNYWVITTLTCPVPLTLWRSCLPILGHNATIFDAFISTTVKDVLTDPASLLF